MIEQQMSLCHAAALEHIPHRKRITAIDAADTCVAMERGCPRCPFKHPQKNKITDHLH